MNIQKKVLLKVLIVSLYFLFKSHFTFGQKENNNWLFGDRAGISFNTSPPSIISGSQLVTIEGVTNVSDADGQLLFYTDGRTVWNKLHQIMSNGNGLSGHVSSTHSALITSDPGNCNKYYIFTTDGIENNLSNGLRYNIVDMNLNNGLGGVEQKNIQLFSSVAEKLVAIPNGDENYIWLITHQWNSTNFVIFKLSADGISAPKTQDIGSFHGGELINAVGYIKASPSGNKIALINRSILSAELFRFDKTSGLLSNNLTIGNQFNLLYGLEFSPDESNLFVGTNNQIYQFRIDPFIQSNIATSQTLITTSSNLLRALQLGPDNKIYVAIDNQSFLGVIHNPNMLGSNTSYIENGIGISGICKFGLPPITVTMHSSPPTFEFGEDTILCIGQSMTLDLSKSFGNYLWQDGSTNSSLTITMPGTYFGSVSNSCGVYTDTIKVNYYDPISLSLGEDTMLCEGESLVFDVSVPNGSYLWQDGNQNPLYTINGSGEYHVTVMNNCETLMDTINIASSPHSNLLPPDTILCPGNTITLNISNINGEFKWQDGTNDPTFIINSSGMYYVEISNKCGVFSDSINAHYRDFDQIIIPNVFTPNNDGLNDSFMLDQRILGSSIKIFNRWGKNIYESPNYQNDWRGEGFPIGNYYYYVVDICGAVYKGWLQIMN